MPAAVATSISPELLPNSSGRRMTRLLPVSSTVVVKSVPRIEMSALGVFVDMFFLSILPSLPLMNLAVPDAIRRANLLLLGLPSKMYSSTTTLLLSVNFRTVSSINFMAIRPLPVRTSSLLIISSDKAAESLL